MKVESVDNSAKFIAEAEARLSAQVRKSFLFMSFATLFPLIVLLGVLVVLPAATRQSQETETLRLLRETNRQIATLSTSILKNQDQDEHAVQEALRLIAQQSELHDQAVKRLQESQGKLPQETQSIIQVVGSAAILALLGALGLQRLQNIDTEINNVRESVFSQAEARAKSIRETLQSQIADEVREQFAATEQEVRKISERAEALLKDIENKVNEFQEEVQQQTNEVTQQLQQMMELIEKYPWLRSEEEYRAASQIQHLASVEEAQRLAEYFRRQGDLFSAKEALRAIVERDLPGDHAAFHNAHAEAMRLKDPKLALEIIELGLRAFPNNADLVADKVKALHSLGRAREARAFIEECRDSHPEQFASSWRPIVFYEDLFESLGLREEDFLALKEAFEYVLSKSPYEIKIWAEYAELLESRGMISESEKTLRRGLEYNPWSQQLNFMLGDLLLRQGRGEEARKFLEDALVCDYQEQYQHDVNQFAVRARLAQCYEYLREFDKAQLLYQSILASKGERDLFPQLLDYARNRLAALALAKGEMPPSSGDLDPEEARKALEFLASLFERGEDDASA